MSTIGEQLHAVFMDAFPACNDAASLEFVEIVEVAEAFGVVVRLIVWETDAHGVQRIDSVKEQQITLRLPTRDAAAIARVTDYVRALVRVASHALAHPEIAQLMPFDLVDFTALKLATPRSEDDFVRALSTRSRLGRYLQPTS